VGWTGGVEGDLVRRRDGGRISKTGEWIVLKGKRNGYVADDRVWQGKKNFKGGVGGGGMSPALTSKRGGQKVAEHTGGT